MQPRDCGLGRHTGGRPRWCAVRCEWFYTSTLSAFDWQDPVHLHAQTTEAFGIPVTVFGPLVEAIRRAPMVPPSVPSLDIEVSAVDVSTLARGTAGKLPLDWVQAVDRSCSSRGRVPRVLKVGKVLPFGASAGTLRPGDVLISVGGHLVVGCADLEDAIVGQSVAITVFRGGKEVSLEVTPSMLNSEDAGLIVCWAGIILRRTPRCALERCGENICREDRAVFAQAILGVSPADGREFMTHWFLLDIDGHPIKALEDVLRVLESMRLEQQASGDRRWVRIRLVDLDGREHVKAIQCDPLFWPTLELSSV